MCNSQRSMKHGIQSLLFVAELLPPRPTLFPYTTLFRSLPDPFCKPNITPGVGLIRMIRSEEHTSELQSPCKLVCRLLLEKKKKWKNKTLARKENSKCRLF